MLVLVALAQAGGPSHKTPATKPAPQPKIVWKVALTPDPQAQRAGEQAAEDAFVFYSDGTMASAMFSQRGFGPARVQHMPGNATDFFQVVAQNKAGHTLTVRWAVAQFGKREMRDGLVMLKPGDGALLQWAIRLIETGKPPATAPQAQALSQAAGRS
jgi:hypothetical protein